jgi:hypothetical protein
VNYIHHHERNTHGKHGNLLLHKIGVTGSQLYPKETLLLAAGSYNYEKLQFEFGSEWQGVVKKIVFYPFRKKPVQVIDIGDNDNIIDVPPEVSLTAGQARYVVEGWSNDARIITVEGTLIVPDTKDVGDHEYAPSTPIYQQLLNIINEFIERAENGDFDGDKGDAGVGVPVGGLAGQFLKKATATDYATVWSYITALSLLLDSNNNTYALGNENDGGYFISNGSRYECGFALNGGNGASTAGNPAPTIPQIYMDTWSADGTFNAANNTWIHNGVKSRMLVQFFADGMKYSTDGVTWTPYSSKTYTDTMDAVTLTAAKAYADGIAVGGGGSALYSAFCDSAATAQIKAVSLPGFNPLLPGQTILITLNNGNTYVTGDGHITLAVDGGDSVIYSYDIPKILVYAGYMLVLQCTAPFVPAGADPAVYGECVVLNDYSGEAGYVGLISSAQRNKVITIPGYDMAKIRRGQVFAFMCAVDFDPYDGGTNQMQWTIQINGYNRLPVFKQRTSTGINSGLLQYLDIKAGSVYYFRYVKGTSYNNSALGNYNPTLYNLGTATSAPLTEYLMLENPVLGNDYIAQYDGIGVTFSARDEFVSADDNDYSGNWNYSAAVFNIDYFNCTGRFGTAPTNYPNQRGAQSIDVGRGETYVCTHLTHNYVPTWTKLPSKSNRPLKLDHVPTADDIAAYMQEGDTAYYVHQVSSVYVYDVYALLDVGSGLTWIKQNT